MQSVARISSSFREMPGGAPLQIRETPGGTSGSARLCGPKGAPGIASPYGSEGGCSYSSVKRDSSFRWAFLAALPQARPGLRPPPAVLRPLAHGSGIQAQLCAASRCRPGPEMTQSAAPRGLAGLQAMRRMVAAEAHRRLVSGCNGHGKRRALAGGGHRRGAGVIPAHGPGVEKGPRTTACMGGRTCTGAKPFKGDPAMRLLGQEPLRRAKSVRGWQDSCAVHDLGASDGENAPWRQDVRAVHSPTALCGAFWIHATHILPKLAESEYMAAIYCHELAFFLSEAPS